MSVYLFVAAVAATVLSTSACGSYSNPSPSAPTGSAGPPAGAIVINVVGINGAQSFSPNPATVPAGQTVVWHNVDTVTHRVVFNDGEVDTGNIAPGAFSAAMGLAPIVKISRCIPPTPVAAPWKGSKAEG